MQKLLNKTLTVDTGFGGTGWAFWKGDKFPITGVLRGPKTKKVSTDEERMQKLWDEFDIILKAYKPTTCYVEKTEVWQGSAISFSSASDGNLMKLQALGAGYGAMCVKAGVKWFFIAAREWKGQLPKEAVDKRIFRINRMKYGNHISDAVGMGFSLAGAL